MSEPRIPTLSFVTVREQKNVTYRYSPQPMSEYKLTGVPHDEVSVIAKSEHPEAVWNLFWLSIPALDSVPGSGHDWWRGYTPTPGILGAILADVYQDEVLYRKLMMHPEMFIQWFEREDHSIFDSYNVLGGPTWVATVLKRAELAVNRLCAEDPPIRVEGNVIRVKFPRVA